MAPAKLLPHAGTAHEKPPEISAKNGDGRIRATNASRKSSPRPRQKLSAGGRRAVIITATKKLWAAYCNAQKLRRKPGTRRPPIL